jgi:hypothetical protein
VAPRTAWPSIRAEGAHALRRASLPRQTDTNHPLAAEPRGKGSHAPIAQRNDRRCSSHINAATLVLPKRRPRGLAPHHNPHRARARATGHARAQHRAYQLVLRAERRSCRGRGAAAVSVTRAAGGATHTHTHTHTHTTHTGARGHKPWPPHHPKHTYSPGRARRRAAAAAPWRLPNTHLHGLHSKRGTHDTKHAPTGHEQRSVPGAHHQSLSDRAQSQGLPMRPTHRGYATGAGAGPGGRTSSPAPRAMQPSAPTRTPEGHTQHRRTRRPPGTDTTHTVIFRQARSRLPARAHRTCHGSNRQRTTGCVGARKAGGVLLVMRFRTHTLTAGGLRCQRHSNLKQRRNTPAPHQHHTHTAVHSDEHSNASPAAGAAASPAHPSTREPCGGAPGCAHTTPH